MRTFLAWPINLVDARSWLAGEIQDHELVLASPGPVWFIYHLEGMAGWRGLAGALAAAEGRYGVMSLVLCRSSVPGLEVLIPRLDATAVRSEDRWLFRAEVLRGRLHAINSARRVSDRC